MDELPFLVVHGAWAWKLLLVILVAATAAAGFGLRWRAERKRVRYLAELRRATACAPREGEVMLRGRLRGGTASTLVRGDVTWDHGEGLWLDHEGERIELASPVRVAAGTRAATSFWRPPPGTPEAIATDWKRGASRLDVLADGDEVMVDGKLARRGEGDAEYRESGATWVLTGVDGAIGATAVAPAVRVRVRSPVRLVLSTAAAIAVWYGVLHKVGTIELENAQKHDDDALETSVSGPLVIAAAMPGSRARALSQLAYELDDRFEHGEATMRLALAVDELRGDCPAKRLLRAVRLEEALTAARACGDHDSESAALVYLGRYAEAKPSSDVRGRGVAAIGSGRWADAAAAAEDFAHDVDSRERTEYFTDRVAAAKIEGVRCVEAWYAARAGDATALAHVGEHPAAACQLVDAIARNQPIRWRGTVDDYKFAAMADALNLEEIEDRIFDVYRAVDNLAFYFDASSWLVPFSIAAAPPERAAVKHSVLAVLGVYKGDLVAARAELARADELAPKELRSIERHSLELAIDLRDPAPFPEHTPDEYVHPGIADAVNLRRGETGIHDTILGAYPSHCEKDLRDGLDKAVAGDGAPLASVFRHCKVYWNNLSGALIGVLPRVKTHREDLGAALRLYRSDITTYDFDDAIFRFLDDIVIYRDMARLAGDTAAAAAWQAIFDRHAQMLADRDRAIGMLLWAALR